jgi:hypothetical protein
LTKEPDGASQWIISPFSMDFFSEVNIIGSFQENLIDMMTDCQFETIFKESARILKGTALPMNEVQLYGFLTVCINILV